MRKLDSDMDKCSSCCAPGVQNAIMQRAERLPPSVQQTQDKEENTTASVKIYLRTSTSSESSSSDSKQPIRASGRGRGCGRGRGHALRQGADNVVLLAGLGACGKV